MNPHKRVFIVGHPGAGKALVAKTLTEKLGWQFIDADFGLEFRAGRTLDEIFGEKAKNGFHQFEFDVLAALLKKENIVVTTDASIICDEKNRQLLKNEFVVYLQVSTSVQIERNSRNPAPLLLVTDIKTFLETLHKERDNLYEQIASLTINSDDSKLEEHVFNIAKVILESSNMQQECDQLTLDEKDLIFFHKTLHIPVRLSDQQAACLKLLAEGKSSKEIATIIGISFRTVEGHIAKIMELLGCSSSKELIVLYHYRP